VGEIPNVYPASRAGEIKNKADTPMTQPYTSSDFDNDYAKERQFIEMGAEQKLRPAPKKILYFPEDTKEDHLREVQRENVEASQARIHNHESS
jgi:hypothetical protein